MTWTEQWQIEDPVVELESRWIADLVDEALRNRGFAIGPAVVYEDRVDGVKIEGFGRYISVAIGVGDLHGSFTIAVPDGEDTGYIEFNSDELRGGWEPLYMLFAELALAIGAVQDLVLAIPYEPEELSDDVRTTVEACISDVLFAEGIVAGQVLISSTEGQGLESFELDLQFRPEAIVVRLVGAGELLEVVARAHTDGFSPEGKEALADSLRDELRDRVAHHRRMRHQRRAPPAAPGRGGKLVIELDQLEHLRELAKALKTHDVDVIRYFSDGEPFWKASYDKGHELDEMVTSLDALHADRTWQWAAVFSDDEDDGVAEAEP